MRTGGGALLPKLFVGAISFRQGNTILSEQILSPCSDSLVRLFAHACARAPCNTYGMVRYGRATKGHSSGRSVSRPGRTRRGRGLRRARATTSRSSRLSAPGGTRWVGRWCIPQGVSLARLMVSGAQARKGAVLGQRGGCIEPPSGSQTAGIVRWSSWRRSTSTSKRLGQFSDLHGGTQASFHASRHRRFPWFCCSSHRSRLLSTAVFLRVCNSRYRRPSRHTATKVAPLAPRRAPVAAPDAGKL